MPKVTPYKKQDYSTIKKALLKKGELFFDSEFPANSKSLFYSRTDNITQWKRPQDICRSPHLVVAGFSASDLQSGSLVGDDTSFLSACCSLTTNQRLCDYVIVDAQKQDSWERGEYAGIFHFRLWRHGNWFDVVIDDLLPCNADGGLVTCRSTANNEFWSALLEKAMAKLHGDYESLSECCTADLLVDLTGGLPETVDVISLRSSNSNALNKLHERISQCLDSGALVNCNIAGQGKVGAGSELPNGLVVGHGYSIKAAKKVKIKSANEYLLKLFNPWNKKEWKGAWSDKAAEWNAISPTEKKAIGYENSVNSEFWMPISDFVDNFTNVDICHFINTSFSLRQKTWTENILHGVWSANSRSESSAGGGVDGKTFLFNPQYCFDVSVEQDQVMVCVDQDDTDVRRQKGETLRTIALHLIKVEDNRRYRVHVMPDVIATTGYKSSRNVLIDVTLLRGRYVIIPSMNTANLQGSFIIRIYTSKNPNVVHLDQHEPPVSGCCSKPYRRVTKLTINKCLELPSELKKDGVYAVVRCEKEVVKTQKSIAGENPAWNSSVIFYRKQPGKTHITVELYTAGLVSNWFLGVATIADNGDEREKTRQVDLHGKKKKDITVQCPGKLYVTLSSSDNLMDL